MRIALVNSNRKTKLYPIALLKLGAWLKSQNIVCKLFNNELPKVGEYDEIWITTVFTFDMFYVKAMIEASKKMAKKVKVGGISASLMPDFYRRLGVDVHVGLHMEAEKSIPDYSLLGFKPEYSIVYTSRGCVRKCKFCMVPKLEPVFTEKEWELEISSESKKVLFYDNNWLAKEKKFLYNDIAKLHRLVDEKRISSIDFNQGLDCRLMTEEIADRLQGLPISPVRFAFDGIQEDGFFQKAVKMMVDRNFHSFTNYILYNFKDSPQDFYYRLRETALLNECCNGAIVRGFPMRYQPINSAKEERDFVGKKWTQREVANVIKIMGAHSGPAGTFSPGTMIEFKYWFGASELEFLSILNYPKLGKFLKKKTAYLRLNPGIRGQRDANTIENKRRD
jgi:hypothetical protein